MGATGFEKFAQYLQHPLILVGFVLLLFFGLARALLKSGLLAQIDGSKSYRVLQTILLYGFVIALVVIAAGFGLRYRELSDADQKSVVGLLKGEFNANVSTAEALRQNTITLLQLFYNTATALRTPGVPILDTLFPAENVAGNVQISAHQMAVAALNQLKSSGLDRNSGELARANAAFMQIHDTIGRTQSSIESLSDLSRYPMSSAMWDAHQSTLHRIRLSGIPEFQDAYGSVRKLRSDYGVVCSSVLAYLRVLETHLAKNGTIDETTLSAMLSQERQTLNLLTGYGSSLTTAMEKIKVLQEHLATVDRNPS